MDASRIADRFLLNVPVIFRWRDRQGIRRRGIGFTRDLSSVGVFVFARNCPRPGTAVKLDLLLPAPGGRATGLRVSGRGRVLRVEADGVAPELGFAVKNDSFSLWEFEN